MLNNFHLAALTRTRDRVQLHVIPLHQSLQSSLAVIWEEELTGFMNGIEEINFNSGYAPEDHERFRIMDYVLPDGLGGVTSMDIQNLDSINNYEEHFDTIRALVGFARNDDRNELILFQNFSRSHVIQPGRFIFLRDGTYESDTRPVLTLDNKLSAVYWPEGGKLLFQNFRITNTFLSLADFYEEASEQEIRDILNHNLLAPVDSETSARGANQWFRKRFAMLRHSGILDRYTAPQIEEHAREYEVDIRIKQDKIVFPIEKLAAKKLLQYLNEELFRGPITETLYETNSKREAD
jgi:hypothetical protein